jgi:hypothetical protein
MPPRRSTSPDTELAALVALLTAEIENTRYPLAPRRKALRAILPSGAAVPVIRAFTQREAYL